MERIAALIMVHIGNITAKRGRVTAVLPPGEVIDFLVAHDIRPLEATEVVTVLRHLDDQGLIRYDAPTDSVTLSTRGEARYMELFLYQT